MDNIQVTHSYEGWKATDANGNEGKASFDEGKEKAIERCKAASDTKPSKKLFKSSEG